MSMMNPVAGPSGPGRFSTRTDLPPSKEYGERKQTEEIMAGAPTATTRGAADPALGRPRTALPEVTPTKAETTRIMEKAHPLEIVTQLIGHCQTGKRNWYHKNI